MLVSKPRRNGLELSRTDHEFYWATPGTDVTRTCHRKAGAKFMDRFGARATWAVRHFSRGPSQVSKGWFSFWFPSQNGSKETPHPHLAPKDFFLRFPSKQPQTSGQKETPALSHLLLVIIRLDLRAQRRSQVDTFPGGNTGGIYSEASFFPGWSESAQVFSRKVEETTLTRCCHPNDSGHLGARASPPGHLPDVVALCRGGTKPTRLCRLAGASG